MRKHASLGVRIVANRERQLRRAALRVGFKLTKSRSSFPAPDAGLFALIDIFSGGAMNPPLAGQWVHSWDLEDVAGYLDTMPLPEPV